MSPTLQRPGIGAFASTRRIRLGYVLDTVLIFAFVAWLIWPLFQVKYLDAWSSIESTFIADARFLRDHWPHPNWQPNWYCGTRTDYVYPPALRYGTAALAKYVPGMLPVRAYHLYIAFFYCFGIAAVYWFVRGGSGSRGAAWLAAIATALVSPSFLFVEYIRDDTPLWMPYRLSVLVRYGEGPHMTALAWIPLALFFSFRALRAWRPASLAAAAVCCAMVVSNNFYGATALALLFPVLAWSVYITHLDKWMWARAVGIGVLAYGLTAFWLVPSYVRLTLDNMRFVSHEGNAWSVWVALCFAIVFVWLSLRLARARKAQDYLLFISGATALFVVNVLGNHFFNFRILGEPARLFPELDMLFILLVAELLRRLWSMQSRRQTAARAAAAVIIAAGLSPSYGYVSKSSSVFVRDPHYEDRIEYKIQDWMAKNRPGARAVTSGSIRFWYNVWHDLPQLGGGSDQGLLNPRVAPPQWDLFLGKDPALSILWMQIMAVDAVIVPGRNSAERYHDYVFPEKFAGEIPVLYDSGSDETIYGIARRYPSLARVVDRAKQAALPEIPGNGELPELRAWHDVIEGGPDSPTETQWEGTDALRVKARVAGGQSVWVAVSYDPNWQAYSGDRPLTVRKDKLGFMVVDAPAGDHEIRLVFPTPLSTIAGRVVALLSLAIIAALIWMGGSSRTLRLS